MPSKELSGVGFEFPFRFVNDWYEYQKDFVRKLDLTAFLDDPIYQDEVCLSEVIIRKCKKKLRKNAEAALFGDRIEIDKELQLSFDEISVMSVLGRNKLNIYHSSIV